MRRRIAVWSAAFALCAMGAAAMLATAAGRPRADAVAPREAAALSPVELQLITNKIREGDLQALKGDIDAARRTWTEARTMGSGLWPAHEGLADSYARNKLHADAEREYATAERLAAGSSRDVIRVKRARNLRGLNRDRDALAILLDLGRPTLTPEIVDLVAQSNDRAALTATLRERADNDLWLWHTISAIEAQAGHRPEAARAFARYVTETAPWDGRLAGQAIQHLREEKLPDEAIELARTYAKAVPQDTEIYVTMGDVLSEAGGTDEALVAYSSIVDLRPADADVHARLAGLLLKMGRRDDARAQLDAATRIKPDVQIGGDLLALMNFDLRITMTWDTQTDIDLYVTDPKGETISYQNRRSTSGAVYHVDNTRAYGPEDYTMSKAPLGTYQVKARFCSGTGRTNVKIVVVRHEGTARQQRSEHSLTLEKTGDEVSIPPVVVTE